MKAAKMSAQISVKKKKLDANGSPIADAVALDLAALQTTPEGRDLKRRILQKVHQLQSKESEREAANAVHQAYLEDVLRSREFSTKLTEKQQAAIIVYLQRWRAR